MNYIIFLVQHLLAYITEPLAIPFIIVFIISILLLFSAARKAVWWKWILLGLFTLLGLVCGLLLAYYDPIWYTGGRPFVALIVGCDSMIIFGILLVVSLCVLLFRK